MTTISLIEKYLSRNNFRMSMVFLTNHFWPVLFNNSALQVYFTQKSVQYSFMHNLNKHNMTLKWPQMASHDHWYQEGIIYRTRSLLKIHPFFQTFRLSWFLTHKISKISKIWSLIAKYLIHDNFIISIYRKYWNLSV